MPDDLLSKIKAKYVDRPDLSETYVDSVGMCTMFSGVYRMEFTATRLDEPPKNPKDPPTGRKYPVVRMAMPVSTAIDLYNNLNSMMAVLEKQGQVSRGKAGATTIAPSSTTVQ